MRLNLLELVQDMLQTVDAENVTTLGDTEEAGMCVQIANRQFEWLSTFTRWRHLKQYGDLTTTVNLNEMVLPTNGFAFDPKSVWYEDQPVHYMEPDDFLRFTIARDSATDSTVTTINGMKIHVDSATQPLYFTSDDDETLRFDATKDSVSGLTGANFDIIYYALPSSRLTADSQTFDLPAVMFPALSQLCVAAAAAELKGDTREGTRMLREAKGTIASMSRNSRLVDKLDDWRKWIVPRMSSRKFIRNPRLK